ncbi:MAG: S8 family serine peptidase [Akkermansiaceae bacterium]
MVRFFFAGANRWVWWGDPNIDQDEDFNFGFYSEFSRDVDAIAYDAETYLPVWSAGNDRGTTDSPPSNGHIGHVFVVNGIGFISNRDRPNDELANGGYDMITHYSVAKNTLTVAATEDVVGGYNGAGSVAMSTFSSWGPVDDGRIKPDISANGVNLTSSAVNGGLLTISGTSMAAPSVTGSVNLLREQYENLIGDADDVLASTYKALTIHTANEAGTSTGPDYRFGWGLMNTLTAANLIAAHGNENSLPHIKEVTLPSGDFVEFTVVAVGGEPLKVTTCWTDPEGTVPPAALDANIPALVNDLDLRVASNGTTHFPWRLDPANVAVAATRNSDNDRDNVEQVLIDTPVAGQDYVIRVEHKGTLVDDDGNEAPQKLSLIISGNVIEEAPVLQVGELFRTGPTEFTAIFETVVGGEYDVETSTDLTSGSWTTAMTGVLPTKDVSALVLPTNGEAKKFWRVIRKK